MKLPQRAFLAVQVLLWAVATFGQEPGPVWRESYARLIPGHEAEYWADFKEHGLPILADAKKQGLFLDYKIYINTYKTSPQDWDVMVAVAYPSMAVMDGLEAKAASTYLNHFGSREKLDAFERRRNQYREVHSIRLVREVFVK